MPFFGGKYGGEGLISAFEGRFLLHVFMMTERNF